MRIGLAFSVIGLLLSLTLAAYGLEPDPDDEFEVDCHAGMVTVTIGNHEVGKAHLRFDGENNTWEPIELRSNTSLAVSIPVSVVFVDVWVVLDGTEVDLMRVCTREASSTTFTITTLTTVSSMSISTTLVTSSTTTSNTVPVPPATTTTTSTTTTRASTTTVPVTVPPSTSTTQPPTTTTTSTPPSECDEDSLTFNPDTGLCGPLAHTGITSWTWPVGIIGAILTTIGGAIIGLNRLMNKGYELEVDIRVTPPTDQ